jgi:hypothetical protein
MKAIKQFRDYNVEKEIIKGGMAESVVSEGEVLVFDEIGTELESLQKKILELMKKATDKKWISTLSAASSALSGLDMKLSQADSKLGAIITESISNFKDFVNEDRSTDVEGKILKLGTPKIAEMLKEVYESACKEAIAYESDNNKEHTLESYLKEMATINAGMMAEMYEKAYGEAKEEDMTKEVFESMCKGMKESYAKKLEESLLSVINKYG